MRKLLLQKPSLESISCLASVVFFCLLYIIVYVNRYALPSIKDVSKPTQFNGKAAYALLEQICEEPRTHTAYHFQVIKKLHDQLDSWCQERSSIHTCLVSYQDLAQNSKNIILFIEGEAKDAALLVHAHHDSVAHSKGATDDGMNVAVLMEVAHSLLLNEKKLPHSIVILLTDEEENGMVGMKKYMENGEYLGKIKAAINNEGSGGGGKVIFFRGNNTRLAKMYASAVPRPHMSSLGNDMLKLDVLQSKTEYDYTKKEWPAADLATFDNRGIYHTTADTIDNVLPGHVQFSGDNLLAFVNAVLESDFLDQPDAAIDEFPLFFDLLNVTGIVMKNANVIAFSAICIVLTIACSIFYFLKTDAPVQSRSRISRVKGAFIGFGYLLLTLILAIGIAIAFLLIITGDRIYGRIAYLTSAAILVIVITFCSLYVLRNLIHRFMVRRRKGKAVLPSNVKESPSIDMVDITMQTKKSISISEDSVQYVGESDDFIISAAFWSILIAIGSIATETFHLHMLYFASFTILTLPWPIAVICLLSHFYHRREKCSFGPKTLKCLCIAYKLRIFIFTLGFTMAFIMAFELPLHFLTALLGDVVKNGSEQISFIKICCFVILISFGGVIAIVPAVVGIEKRKRFWILGVATFGFLLLIIIALACSVYTQAGPRNVQIFQQCKNMKCSIDLGEISGLDVSMIPQAGQADNSSVFGDIPYTCEIDPADGQTRIISSKYSLCSPLSNCSTNEQGLTVCREPIMHKTSKIFVTIGGMPSPPWFKTFLDKNKNIAAKFGSQFDVTHEDLECPRR